MPSNVQPVQAAQNPVTCPRVSLLRVVAVAATLEMLLMRLFSLAF
jgi:hypothetical protein